MAHPAATRSPWRSPGEPGLVADSVESLAEPSPSDDPHAAGSSDAIHGEPLDGSAIRLSLRGSPASSRGRSGAPNCRAWAIVPACRERA